MAITEAYGRTFAGTTSEVSVIDNATKTNQAAATAGAFQAWADLTTLQPGDVFEIRLYEKVLSGGAQGVSQKWVISAQGTDNKIWTSPTYQLLQGWDWTLKRTAGATDRAIPFAVRKAS